jgi:predicted dehydrogenase
VGAVIVGTAFGSRIHVPAARDAGFDVAALVGADPERTTRRAARAGVPHAFTSLTQALQLPGVDAVIIATPPTTHADLAEQAIRAGQHVLVEKPFTMNAQEARRLCALADEAGVVALVGHEFRFAPERVTLERALRRGDIGTPQVGTFIGHTDFAITGDIKMPKWWFSRQQGGGWLGASVSHLIDAVRVWLGDVESVSANLQTIGLHIEVPDADAEDTVSARLQMVSGCEVIVQQSASIWGRGVNLMRVAGTSATLEIVDGSVTCWDRNGSRTLDPDRPAAPVDSTGSGKPWDRFTHIELDPAKIQAAVFRDLIEGAVPDVPIAPATFSDGVACMEVIDAIRRSAAHGGALTKVRT